MSKTSGTLYLLTVMVFYFVIFCIYDFLNQFTYETVYSYIIYIKIV